MLDWLWNIFRPNRPDPAPDPPGPQPADLESVRQQMLAGHNARRAKSGASPLARHPALDEAAQKHAEYMAAWRIVTHRGIDGSIPDERIRRAGYSGGWTGENAAMNQGGVSATVSQWMDSWGHRSNILRAQYRHMGVGMAVGSDGNSYWVVTFGG